MMSNDAREAVDYVESLVEYDENCTPAEIAESVAFLYLSRWERIKTGLKIILLAAKQ